MNAEEATHLLAHALPSPARAARWRRTFTVEHRSELRQLGVTDAQAERLERILPAIAYCAAQGPRLADVRAPLVQLGKDAHKAANALRTLLEARDEARQEGRMRMLETIEALHPERCEVDPARVSFFHSYDHREPEALRMLAALQDLEAVAKRAVERMPKSQTRAVAHHYPVALIDAALSVDGPAFTVSASAGSAFRDVATVCFATARQGEAEPLRAIRAYLSARNGSRKK